MPDASLVDRLLLRWQTTGILDDATAARLRDDIAEHGLPTSPDHDPSQRLRSVANAGLEALGYLGAALTIGALGYLGNVTDWPRPALIVLLALVSGACGLAVQRLAPAREGAMERLVTVLGVTGVASLAGMMAMLVIPDCANRYDVSCGWFGERLAPLAVALPATAAAFWLHRRQENAVTHFAFGLGVVATLFTLSQLVFKADSERYRTHGMAAAAVLLPAALAWVWASETERLRPAWIGTLGASGVALASTITLTDFSLFADNHGSVFASTVFGLAFVTVGMLTDRWRLTSVGAVVTLFTLPWLMVDVLGLSPTTTSLTLLPVGLAMIGFVAKRLRKGADSGTAPRA